MVLFCSGEREGVEMVEVGDVGWWSEERKAGGGVSSVQKQVSADGSLCIAPCPGWRLFLGR